MWSINKEEEEKRMFNPFDEKHNVFANDYAQRRQAFMNSFGSTNIYCYNNNPKTKLSGMNHVDDITVVLNNNIKQNCDSYFYVNGSRKKDETHAVRACYIDLDAGRDINGHYFAPKVVMEKKKEFMSKLLGFGVKPTWIVDTRNGYQAYWILTKKDHDLGLSKNKTYWNGIQKKLANYFSADIRAMKINQIFRVPFTWWRKPWEGKKSYFCTLCVESSGNRTSMVELQNALTGQSAQVHVKSASSSDAWYEKIRSSKHTSNAVPISAECATKILNELINEDTTNPTIIGENEDIPDYVSDEPESNSIMDAKCTPNEDQLKLLSSVVHFLNQVTTPLYFSNNKFLSAAAKELAAKMSDEFCVG
jgi:hypothetical protein